MYIELIYILNFLLDYMILYGTKRLLKINTTIKRLFIASLIGSLTTNILFISINSISLFIIKVIVSIIMNLVAFKKENLIKNTLYFYLISIIIGGSIYLLDIKTAYLKIIILIVIPPLIIYLYIKENTNYKLNYKDKYIVKITVENKVYNLEGFVDTGNHLKDPVTKKSVILVNLELPLNKVLYIPYKALNTEGIIPCIKPEKIEIDNKIITNCLIGIAKDKITIPGINCILPNKLKEEL